jgi:hypothetical protein
MLAHHRPEPVDLDVQRGNDRDLAANDRGIGVLEHRWLPKLLGRQHLAQLGSRPNLLIGERCRAQHRCLLRCELACCHGDIIEGPVPDHSDSGVTGRS